MAMTFNGVMATVRADQVASNNRWEQAIASDGPKWSSLAEECDAAYDAALEALAIGDLAGAEIALLRASAAEGAGGDNCDAHHALSAVRAA